MSMTSFLQRFASKKPNKSSLSIVIFSDGIYLSKITEESVIEPAIVLKLEDKNWQTQLGIALDNEGCNNLKASVTLGSHLYHSYQIEKPAIPKNEWPVALPFLLKDLITGRIADIISDGVELPYSTKIQAYVITKKLLADIQSELTARNIELLQILPEDQVWAISSQVTPFILLHRNSNSEFKIGAFVDGVSVFHRTIRGVVPPITGNFSSSLLQDDLALELQRSMDYLSSQLKQIQINKLMLCCDDEDSKELQKELQDRLNINVEPLQLRNGGYQSGGALAVEAYEHGLQGINLYPEHLQPKKEWFDLNLIVFSWVLISFIMMIIYGVYSYQNNTLSGEISKLNHESNTLLTEKKSLDQKLIAHKPSAAKIAAISRLKENVKTKQDSLNVINSFDDEKLEGYSGVMSSLANLNSNEISLNSIQIDDNKLNVQGYARNPEVVPSWVGLFKDELSLVGRTFEHLSIGRDDKDNVIFSLRSIPGNKK